MCRSIHERTGVMKCLHGLYPTGFHIHVQHVRALNSVISFTCHNYSCILLHCVTTLVYPPGVRPSYFGALKYSKRVTILFRRKGTWKLQIFAPLSPFGGIDGRQIALLGYIISHFSCSGRESTRIKALTSCKSSQSLVRLHFPVFIFFFTPLGVLIPVKTPSRENSSWGSYPALVYIQCLFTSSLYELFNTLHAIYFTALC